MDNFFSVLNKYLKDFLNGVISNITLLVINLLLILLFLWILKYMAKIHLKNSISDERKLPITCNMHDGSSVKFNIIGFDGENYRLIIDVDRFEAGGITNPKPVRVELMVNKRDVDVRDFLKMFTQSLCKNHNIFRKFSEKRLSMTNKTTSNLNRLLLNAGLIGEKNPNT